MYYIKEDNQIIYRFTDKKEMYNQFNYLKRNLLKQANTGDNIIVNLTNLKINNCVISCGKF